MYILYCLLLWVLVYFLPGLAVFPRLICSPLTAFATPIVSVGLIYSVTSLLIAIGLLVTPVVIVVALAFGIVGIVRMRAAYAQNWLWTKADALVYGMHAIVLLPYFIKLGTHGFDRGDEIYSWNFWAIQHYFLETIDFSHTGAPYPQLFPKLLAFCYHLVGNIDLQLPVKATLIIFPWTMLCAIAMVWRTRIGQLNGVYGFVLVYVLWGVNLGQFFDDGYADPVMTCALIVSMVLFWQSQQRALIASFPATMQVNPTLLAGLSVLCAIVAAHTKQPALLFTLFTLPLLLWQHRSWRWLAILSLVGGLYWVLGEGRQFHHNKGVIWLSLANRDLFSQLAYAINKYFIQQPLLFLLFFVAWWISRRDKTLRQLSLLFMVPSLCCWFFFGAYQLRLGQHLIAGALFLLAAGGFNIELRLFNARWWRRWLNWYQLKQKQLLVAVLGLSVCISALLFAREVWLVKGGISLYAGGRQSLHRYFGKDTDYVYHTIYSDPELLLWVPSRYLYGLFYKHTKLTTPDYLYYGTYNYATLIDELQRKLPDYVFTVSQDIIDGSASQLLAEVVNQCPQAFSQVAGPYNRFSFVTYKVDKNMLARDQCLLALVEQQPFEYAKLAQME